MSFGGLLCQLQEVIYHKSMCGLAGFVVYAVAQRLSHHKCNARGRLNIRMLRGPMTMSGSVAITDVISVSGFLLRQGHRVPI